jgi:hypothetical protein
MYKRKTNFTKRSGYVLALIDRNDIIRLNGFALYSSSEDNIEEEIFILPRKSTNETEALLAIKLKTYQTILQSSQTYSYFDNDSKLNKECEILKALRSHCALSNIAEIQTLYIKYSFIINRIVNYLINDEDWKNDYILINIEPKGFGKLEKTYPAPILTLPGGTMEPIDNGDYEECAFREFYEETCINIKESNYLCITKDFLKCSKDTKFNHFTKIKNKNKNNNTNLKISWYFSIKLFNPSFDYNHPSTIQFQSLQLNN